MHKSFSTLEAFRALTILAEQFTDEAKSENLGVLVFEMQPSPLGSNSSDPALFEKWERLWGEGDKEPAQAAEVSHAFVLHEADWGYDDDGAAVIERFLDVAGRDPSSVQFKRWVKCLEAARGVADDKSAHKQKPSL